MNALLMFGRNGLITILKRTPHSIRCCLFAVVVVVVVSVYDSDCVYRLPLCRTGIFGVLSASLLSLSFTAFVCIVIIVETMPDARRSRIDSALLLLRCTR